MMDDNTALVAIAAITAVPATLSAVFGYLAVRQSRLNGVVMEKVSSQTDGLMTKTLEAERREAAANVTIARHEGSDEARKDGEARAAALIAAAPVGPTEVSIVEAAVTVPVEIKDKKP